MHIPKIHLHPTTHLIGPCDCELAVSLQKCPTNDCIQPQIKQNDTRVVLSYEHRYEASQPSVGDKNDTRVVFGVVVVYVGCPSVFSNQKRHASRF